MPSPALSTVAPRVVDFGAVLAALNRELAAQGIPFMIIGGQAVLLHGEPRLTQDIDITLGIDPTGLPLILAVCAALDLQPLPHDPEKFVLQTFVLPARPRTLGPRVDFIFSNTEYERLAIERAVRVELGGERIPFASAEDLIIHKLFAGRPRDFEDAASVVRGKGKSLDWKYLMRWAKHFQKVPGREMMPEQLTDLKRLI